MKKVEVVAAVIIKDSKILCVQRGVSKLDYISKKWEFPGGKIEENESFEDALMREIQEELRLKIKVEKLFLTVEHTYQDFHLTMHSYLCETENTELTLTEHLDFKWLEKENLLALDWAAADVPIVKKLMLS
jgi:8-oxo-dGTP diphosphatase